MPHIAVNMYPGRTEERKQEIAEKVQKVFVDELGFKAGDISVSVVETEADNFVKIMEERYKKEDLYIASDYIH